MPQHESAGIRRGAGMELWVGCIAGAFEESEYAARLRAPGFVEVEIEPWRVYTIEDARSFLTDSGLDVDRLAPAVEGRFASAFVRARSPSSRRSSCLPEVCRGERVE